ncbi:MAG: alpha-1,2-fucosyltransferase [Bacteroidetes bacterium]|jgi:hypothetical protein|nr:alpha-1,2-fucosyltransferase [Bacteroidota bacterium]
MAAEKVQHFNMIIVNLKGGLGNQMFQYAAAFALARRNRTKLLLSTTSLENSVQSDVFTKREFELGVFQLDPQFASVEELIDFLPERTSYWYRLLRRFAPSLIRNRVYRYDLLRVDHGFMKLGADTYIDGYFHSEFYFKEVEDELRKEFAFCNPTNEATALMAQRIRSCQSVSLHVRRSDYLKPINEKLFGNICTVDYYKQAVSYIKTHLKDPVFFLFSDDPEWVKVNIDTGTQTHVIDFNTSQNSFEDMRLMSLCRHHIIANSSFSWWGAWLNPDNDKIVIGPSVWINQPDADINDILPAAWVRI